MGAAGAADPEVRETLRRLLLETVHGSVHVVGDMEIALEAAFAGSPGMVVCSGTGSLAFGRSEHGITARAGGWGFQVSDEGSGYWIGHAAVAALLTAHDNGENTLLESLILKTWQVPTREAMVAKANSQPAPDFSELCPQVLAAADAGDSAASGILTQAGVELSRLAVTVLRRLWPEAQPVRVAFAGGVFQNSALVRKSFHNHLRAQRPDAVLSFSVINPVTGALALARKGLAEFAARR
jgi:N-acetylglucosamine kinase-like BadF-type ATPase